MTLMKKPRRTSSSSSSLSSYIRLFRRCQTQLIHTKESIKRKEIEQWRTWFRAVAAADDESLQNDCGDEHDRLQRVLHHAEMAQDGSDLHCPRLYIGLK